MDILHYLKTHHDAIRVGCQHLFEATSVSERRRQLEGLARATQVYLVLEREFLYPEISGLFATADGLLAIAETNATLIEKQLKTLLKLMDKADAATFSTAVQALQETLSAHFEQEEQGLMPKMRLLIRTEDREDLGQVFADAEAEVLATSVAAELPGAVAAGRRRA